MTLNVLDHGSGMNEPHWDQPGSDGCFQTLVSEIVTRVGVRLRPNKLDGTIHPQLAS